MSDLTKRLFVRMLFIVSLLCYALTALTQTYFTIDGHHKRVGIPFKLVRNMIVVRLKINNKGPYNFVMDTGVGMVIITDPDLVDSVNIEYKRLVKITGLGIGHDYEAYFTPSIDLDIPGLVGKGIPAAILKKDQFNLSNYAGIPIHGLLGYEFFNSFAVKVNFNDSTLTVGAPGSLRVFRKSEKLPISVEDNKPYLTTNIKFTDGKEMNCKLVIDLGAGHPLLLENQTDQNYEPEQKRVSANLGMGLTGPISGYLSRISEIGLAKYQLKNIITSFPDQDSSKMALSVKRDGNIGINILKRFNLIIDYQSKTMYIKPNALFDESFEHDMSGMEYAADGPDYKHITITRVEQNSPADQVGIETGDEILAINFKPTEKMTVEEIDNIFRSRDDRSLLLEISHKDKQSNIILRLKKRI